MGAIGIVFIPEMILPPIRKYMSTNYFHTHKPTASHGGAALELRWRRKLLRGHKWFRLYWFAMSVLILMAIWMLRNCLLVLSLEFDSNSTEQIISTIVIVSLSFIARTQLVSLATFIALEDLTSDKWDALRSTPISTRQIAAVLLKNSLLLGVMPMSILLLAGVLTIGPAFGGSTFLFDNIIPFDNLILGIFSFIALGLNLTALAMIFGLLIKRPFGAVIGVLIPAIYTLILVLGLIFFDFELWNMSNFSTRLFDYAVLLTVPEGFFAQIWDTSTIDGPSDTDYSLWYLLLMLSVGAAFWWGILLTVIHRKRTARG